MLVLFALSISTSALLLSGVPSTTSDQNSDYPLLFSASLTFFLGTTRLTLLLATNSTNPRLIDYLAMAILITSFSTLFFSFPKLFMALANLNELSNGRFGWAIQSALICFAIAMLHKLIDKAFASCRHQCLNVAFLSLCVAFSGLYTEPPFYLPGAIPYNSIIHRTDRIYHFALVPVTFVLGTILSILGCVAPAADLLLPSVSLISKEDLTVSTLAVGMATLLIGASLMISAALVNFAMAGGGGGGWPGGAVGVGAM